MTTAPTRLVLQQRDLQLLSCLGEHSVLDTDMIHARFFAGVSLRRCQQRLALLEKQGLTRTVPLTLWSADASGCSVPTVHSLTERGVEAVEAMTGHRPARVSRGDPKPETIHHRLQIVRTKLTIDDACRSLNLAWPRADSKFEHELAPGRTGSAAQACLATAMPPGVARSILGLRLRESTALSHASPASPCEPANC